MGRGIGLNSMEGEFERQRREILELWQTCNVSLVHRTYFYLLFKGDEADSIYIGVELRRLLFMKDSFPQGNQALEGGETLTLASRLDQFGVCIYRLAFVVAVLSKACSFFFFLWRFGFGKAGKRFTGRERC